MNSMTTSNEIYKTCGKTRYMHSNDINVFKGKYFFFFCIHVRRISCRCFFFFKEKVMIYTKDVTHVRQPKTKFGSNLKCRVLRHVTARLDRIYLRISVDENF